MIKQIIPWKKNNDVDFYNDFNYSFADLHRNIDNMLNSFFDDGSTFNLVNKNNFLHAPKIDVLESDNNFIVKADLPGLDEKDITINLNDNKLTIKGERTTEKKEKNDKYYIAERQSGTFSRVISLPENTIDEEKIKATFKQGVLTLDLPKLPERVKKPEKQIKIETTN